jgi:WhiB family redox-sensing transcriptional regulator
MHPDAVAGLMLGHEVPEVAELLGRPSWEARAACRGMPVETFVIKRGEPTAAAKAVCARCPVVGECLDYALADSSLSGVWGGTSTHERTALRKLGPAPEERASA